MSSNPSGGYADALGALTLICGTVLLALFLSNRHLFPIAQRSPVLSAISNAAHTFIIALWLLEINSDIPLVVHKIANQIGMGLVVVGFFVRAFRLYLDTGLAKERVENKLDGWFIRHRNWRSRAAVIRLTLALVFFHVILMFFSVGSHTEDNLKPARNRISRAEDFVTTGVIVLYFLTYMVFAVLLAKTQDGFYFKHELGLVGLGMLLTSGFSPLQNSLKLPCIVPACNIFILWLGWFWMITWSVAFPLIIAKRDAHFSWTACFRPGWLKKHVTRGTLVSRSSRPSGAERSTTQGEFPSFHTPREAQLEEVRRKLSDGRLIRLKHVPLATFLTYPAGREAFRRFTVREFSVENLLFVEAVKALHDKATVTKAECQEIYELFIADSAPSQVNLPSGSTAKILARMEETGPEANLVTIFDEASTHVLKLLQRDAYKRFQNTLEWAQYVVVFDTEPKTSGELAESTVVESAGATSAEASRPTTFLTEGTDPMRKEASAERESTMKSDHVAVEVSAVERGSAMSAVERCSTPEGGGEQV